LDGRLDGGVRGRGHSGRTGAAPRRGVRRSADPGARHGGRGRACQGGQAKDPRRAAQAVGQPGRPQPCRADARPARRRDKKGSETMARAKGVLAALALNPLLCGAALAQNSYSFIDAERSPVRYGVASAKPVMACGSLTGLATPDTTILSAVVVPAADGVPEHCRLAGLIAPEIRFEVNLPASWNRRFYMHGNGGFAGEAPDFGYRPLYRANALKQGFATATTNPGHDATAEPNAAFAV